MEGQLLDRTRLCNQVFRELVEVLNHNLSCHKYLDRVIKMMDHSQRIVDFQAISRMANLVHHNNRHLVMIIKSKVKAANRLDKINITSTWMQRSHHQLKTTVELLNKVEG